MFRYELIIDLSNMKETCKTKNMINNLVRSLFASQIFFC